MKNKKWYVVIILLSFSVSIYLLTNGTGYLLLKKEKEEKNEIIKD